MKNEEEKKMKKKQKKHARTKMQGQQKYPQPVITKHHKTKEDKNKKEELNL